MVDWALNLPLMPVYIHITYIIYIYIYNSNQFFNNTWPTNSSYHIAPQIPWGQFSKGRNTKTFYTNINKFVDNFLHRKNKKLQLSVVAPNIK